MARGGALLVFLRLHVHAMQLSFTSSTGGRGPEDATTPASPCRDRFLEPFSSDSIWNTAIGSNAKV